MDHPYKNLEQRAFWKAAVSNLNPLAFQEIYRPKFPITKATGIAAAGSCFAQHIGRQFKDRGYRFIDVEPAPRFLGERDISRFGFDLYSARYGNIYSVRQLLQLFQRAFGLFTPEETVWESKGRFYDPFRPSIEPNGFATREEAERDIEYHLQQVRAILGRTQLFVFTFGLTEGWINTQDGSALPTCPGTIAGEYDDQKYAFHNYTHAEVLEDAKAFIEFALARAPNMKFMFTVSPVPLTATASGHHVLPATVYSKSVLRGVCGELYDQFPQVDYFPSYELVSSHPMRAMAYNPNLRSVATEGVRHVMDVFFNAISEEPSADTAEAAPEKPAPEPKSADDLACDELILQEFGE